MPKIDIASKTLPQLTELLAELGEPAFRAGQIFSWMHKKGTQNFAKMTNLSLPLRAKLEEICYINWPKPKKKLVSSLDGTVKYLYGLSDGQTVETVLMEYRHGHSLCLSTQAGCRMGCAFCASTIGGLQRGLSPSEMLGQVYLSGADSGVRVGSVVLMGIGEPLDNYDHVLDFLRILSDPKGLGLSLRHLSLSTCGLVDQIRRLAEEKLPLTLSVSLHASNDALRNQIMPINHKWPIAELMAACRDYFAATGRRISFEYAVIDGFNDGDGHARELAALLRGLPCHVNLIPVNTVHERPYRRANAARVRSFQACLESRGITATIRRELGGDIQAACGQLRREQAVSNL